MFLKYTVIKKSKINILKSEFWNGEFTTKISRWWRHFWERDSLHKKRIKWFKVQAFKMLRFPKLMKICLKYFFKVCIVQSSTYSIVVQTQIQAPYKSFIYIFLFKIFLLDLSCNKMECMSKMWFINQKPTANLMNMDKGKDRNLC